MEGLSERYLAYARERGESPELLHMKINEFHEILHQMNFQYDNHDISDDNIIRFLRARNMNVEYAVKTFINWIKFRVEHPTWFHELHAKEFGKRHRLCLFSINFSST